MKRTVSLILLASMMAGLISCGGKTPASDTTVPTQTDSASDTAAVIEYPDLEGFTLNVAKIDQSNIAWSNNTFDPEGETGEVLNDILFRRNSFVEQAMNCVIQETVFGSITSEARKNILADDGTFNLYMEKLRDMAALTAEDLFVEIHELDTLNLDKDYWDQDFLRDTSVLDKNYMLVGDLLLTTADCLYAIIYSKKVAEDFEIRDLYQTVRDGKWTLDVLNTLAARVTGDLNGDSKYDYNDRWGIISVPSADPIYAFLIGCGQNAFALNEDDEPEFIAGSNRFLDVYEKISKLYGGDDLFNLNDYTTLKNRDAIAAMFQNDQMLFLPQCISAASQYLRGAEQDFGFLPMPKYEESQEFYLSHVNMGAPVFFVPKTNGELDRTGAVLDALAAYSAEHLMPAYYDTCFSAKYTRDDESYEMLLLALEHKVYDLGFIWKWGDFMNLTAACIKSGAEGFASVIASNSSSINAGIETTLKSLQSGN